MIEKRGNKTWYRAVKSFYKLGKKGRVKHVVATMAACLTLAFTSPALATAITIVDARTESQELAVDDSMTVTQTGSIDVISDMGIKAINASSGLSDTSIINNGTISGTTNSDGAGVIGIFSNAVDNSSITNAGTIELTNSYMGGYAFGIQTGGLTDNSSVENTGTITLSSSFHWDGQGLNTVSLDGIIGTCDDTSSISNSGTISLSADSAKSLVGIIKRGTGTVTNTGTISLSADSAYSMTGIMNNSITGMVTNAGTISLSVDQTTFTQSGGTYDTSLKGIYSMGDVINSGTITATTGTGELNDNFYSVSTTGTLTNNEGGILKGRLKAGNTTNSGLIQLSTGISSIDGTFTQTATGTLGITLYSDASGNVEYSKLAVSGTATLEENSGIYVDVTTASANPLLFGTTLTSVISSTTGISVDTSTLNVTDNSLLLNFTATANSNSLDLNITEGMSITDATQAGGMSGMVGMADVLDNLSGTSDTDLSAFLGHLNTLSSEGAVAGQVAQAAPVNAAQGSAVGGQVLNAMGSVIQARQNSLSGSNSGDNMFSDRNLWVQPFTTFMDQDDKDGVSGFSATAYGIGMGADGEIASGDRLGLALFYTQADADTNNLPQENDMDVVNLMVYGDRALPKAFTLFWQAGAGIQDTESSRYIEALGQTAKADYTSKNIFARTRAVRSFQVNPSLTATAGAAISYTFLHTPSYSEKGAGGLNLDVDSFDTQSLVPALEGGLTLAANQNIQYTAHASLGYDLIDDDTAVTSQFQGAGAAFTTEGIDNSPVVFTAGLGMSKKFTDRFSVNASYDLEGRGTDFLSQMISCKLNWTF